ncbi:MAG: hypothetical protein QGG64_26310 [Candidatus Latescibacteria bacterium]|jgi:hypothetical protein|nr:hypothetical protein [Candidatus Latescibacterota bacterium]
MSEQVPESLLANVEALEHALKEDPESINEQLKTLLPALKDLVRQDQQLQDVAGEGRKILAQTSVILTGLGQSTEKAANEVFEILQGVAYSEGDGLELKLSPEEIREQLLAAMNALQFQDIVAQQVKAIQALINAFDQTLAPHADAPDAADMDVEVEGAFDATAQFDRDRVDPDDLDAWINEAKEG